MDRGPLRGSERRRSDLEHHAAAGGAINRRRAGPGRARRLLRRPPVHRRWTDPDEGRHIDSTIPRQRVRGRPWSWITGRPRLNDALIVVFNFATGALSLVGTNYRRSVLAALL